MQAEAARLLVEHVPGAHVLALRAEFEQIRSEHMNKREDVQTYIVARNRQLRHGQGPREPIQISLKFDEAPDLELSIPLRIFRAKLSRRPQIRCTRVPERRPWNTLFERR